MLQVADAAYADLQHIDRLVALLSEMGSSGNLDRLDETGQLKTITEDDIDEYGDDDEYGDGYGDDNDCIDATRSHKEIYNNNNIVADMSTTNILMSDVTNLENQIDLSKLYFHQTDVNDSNKIDDQEVVTYLRNQLTLETEINPAFNGKVLNQEENQLGNEILLQSQPGYLKSNYSNLSSTATSPTEANSLSGEYRRLSDSGSVASDRSGLRSSRGKGNNRSGKSPLTFKLDGLRNYTPSCKRSNSRNSNMSSTEDAYTG